jgi:hypothetical protein
MLRCCQKHRDPACCSYRLTIIMRFPFSFS